MTATDKQSALINDLIIKFDDNNMIDCTKGDGNNENENKNDDTNSSFDKINSINSIKTISCDLLNNDYLISKFNIKPDYAEQIMNVINGLKTQITTLENHLSQQTEIINQAKQNGFIPTSPTEIEDNSFDSNMSDIRARRSVSVSPEAPTSPLPFNCSPSTPNQTTVIPDFTEKVTEETTEDDNKFKGGIISISENIDEINEELIFSHRVCRAWRWDKEQNKWRGRGKGKLSIYFNKLIGRAKITFLDEKHDKIRLLQYIDGEFRANFYNPRDREEIIHESDDEESSVNMINQEEVEFFGVDYVMDKLDPLPGYWKLAFPEDQIIAKKYMDVYNFYIDAQNKAITLQDAKKINQKTKDIVNGYIKKAQQLFPSQQPLFYTIPALVYHWCLLYFNDNPYPLPFPKLLPVDPAKAGAENECGETATIEIKPDQETEKTENEISEISENLLTPQLVDEVIAIPATKEERQELVGKPINFDEVKMIDQKTKDKVIGYIRRISNEFPEEYDQKNQELGVPPFYIIPQLVMHWCLLYFHDSFAKMVRDVYNTSIQTQIGSIQKFRKLLSTPDGPPIQEIIDSGVVPRFIQLLNDHHHPHLQFESLWALLNIASGPAQCTAEIIRNNSQNSFIHLLNTSPYYEIKEQSMWALGNIAGDGQDLKDLLLMNDDHDILVNMLAICQSNFDKKHVTNFNNADIIKTMPMFQFLSLLSTTSWTLSNLCRGSPPPTQQHLEMILRCITSLMQQALNFNRDDDGLLFGPEKNGDEIDVGRAINNKKARDEINDILSNIAWAASYLTGYDYGAVGYNGINYMLNKLFNNGIMTEFVKLMDYKSGPVRHSCNRMIGNVLTGSDENTHKCIQLGILKKYYNTLTIYCIDDENVNNDTAKRKREKKEICWAISNITAGPIEDKLLVEEHGLFEILCNYLSTASYDVGKEALWALSNATTDHDSRIIDKMVNEYNLIEQLQVFLRQNVNTSVRISSVAFECIENVLISGQSKRDPSPNVNKYHEKFEEDGMLQYLKDIQSDESIKEEIIEKAVDILERFFVLKEDDKNDEEEEEKKEEIGQEEETDDGNNNKNNNENDNPNERARQAALARYFTTFKKKNNNNDIIISNYEEEENEDDTPFEF